MTGRDDVHQRLTAWQTATRAAMATQRLDLPFAVGIITDDLPAVYDQNLMVVTARVPATVLLRSVDQLARAAGWRHRRIEVDDAALAEALRPALLAAGYGEERLVTMALSDDLAAAGADGDVGAAATVGVEQQLELARAVTAQEPWADSDQVVDQMVERERRLARVTGGRAVVAPPEAPVSRCLLLADPSRHLVEIDAVATLADQRGRGWSRAVMRHAISEARSVPDTDVALVADESDWPLAWYRRLGFGVVGRSTAFRLDPWE